MVERKGAEEVGSGAAVTLPGQPVQGGLGLRAGPQVSMAAQIPASRAA